MTLLYTFVRVSQPGGITTLAITALFQWAKLGVNISNFPVSVSAIVFHAGLAGMYNLIVTIIRQAATRVG